MAERILSGKIKQLVYTTEELSQSPLSTTVIDNGVLVYEKTSSGQIKCKMGDGNNIWSGLNYIEDSDKMDKINPTGTGSFSMNRVEGSTIGTNSVALGTECFASGEYCYAEGWRSASGNYGEFSIDSSSIGNETINDKTMIYLEVSYSGDTFPILVGDSIYIYIGSDYSIKSSVQSISNTDNSYTYRLYVDEYESINSIINNMPSSFEVAIIYVDNNLEICKCSHAEGAYTIASGGGSHAEGGSTTASGMFSHTEGYGTIASSYFQHVQGQYNIEDTSSTYAHIVGGGSDDSNRKNIHTLDWNGNAVFSGDVTATDSNGNTVSLLNSTINSDTIVSVSNGGTGYNTITDITYTTARYRASSLNSSETTPTINGVIAWTYE